MAGLVIEYYYRCGCHGHTPNCDIHGANSFAEASARGTTKKYKRRKNSVISSMKTSLGFFPELLIFDHFRNKPADFSYIKKYSKKAKYLLVTTDDHEEVLEKFKNLNYKIVDAVVYKGVFDIEEGSLSQLVLSSEPLSDITPTLSYLGNSSLLETYWLKCIKPESLGVINATTRNWFVAAVKQKVKHTIHTKFFLLEKRIVNTKFQELINTPEERYDGNVR